MKLSKNEGNLDRIIRVIVGIVLLLLAFYRLNGILQIIVYVAALAMFVTAATGFCGLYKLLKINTDKKTNHVLS